MTSNSRTQGLTLIEVLVTLVLFSLLLGLVSQFFVAQSRAANLQKAQNEANEATRTALGLIAWDLQTAGYRATTSSAKALDAFNDTAAPKDIVTTRFFDEDASPPGMKKVRYSVAQGTGETVTSLHRAYYDDPALPAIPQAVPPDGTNGPSIASMVALNLRYETRANQYLTPTGSGSSKTCSTGSLPYPVGATGAAITNCTVAWVWADVPQRLVRQVKVQVLSRSETRVSRRVANQTFNFEGGGSVTTQPGFVYHFAEQTVLVPNLGR